MTKIIISSVALLAIVSGCGMFGKKPSASNDNVTEVMPPPPSHVTTGTGAGMMSTPVVQTAMVEPVVTETTMAVAPAAGQKYTVKKGDTLWSIAQKTYGNGNQFKKIVAANPSIKGETIMVGQTITLP